MNNEKYIKSLEDKIKLLEAEAAKSYAFKKAVYKIAFGDNAINRNFTQEQVINQLNENDDLALDALEQNARELLDS